METTRPAPLDQAHDKPAGRQAASYWRVDLVVGDRIWWPTWTGQARDARDASRQAEAWFYGQLHGEPAVRNAYPVSVRACCQLGAVDHA